MPLHTVWLSIIEPVVRPPRRGDKFDREQAIIDAAKELGDSGADLYKVEMPLYGKGTATRACSSASQRLNDHINMPWVILSSGVDEKLFPRAVTRGNDRGRIWIPGRPCGLGHRSSACRTPS